MNPLQSSKSLYTWRIQLRILSDVWHISFCCFLNSQFSKTFPLRALWIKRYAFFCPESIAPFNLNLISLIGSLFNSFNVFLSSIFDLKFRNSSLLERTSIICCITWFPTIHLPFCSFIILSMTFIVSNLT